MISISRVNKRLMMLIVAVFAIVAFTLPLQVAVAQNSLSLAVTPTLFEMSANPGQIWQSSIKVINSNPFEITVYPSAVNFEPQGEVGQGKLIPVFTQVTEGATLAEWINISSNPVTIPSESSKSVQFTVEVPADASPGGHFAAIMISTQPPAGSGQQLSVRTAQAVTSLFFVRIDGEVIESGTIRSFSVARSFLQLPTAEFELRFENKGNVHLQPRGNITIQNMWGTERGSIPINYRTHFGNVLPNSIRKFNFTWTGEQSLTDIGRYKAVVALGYGTGNTQFVSSATYFWVVPIKAMSLTLTLLFGVIFVITMSIKLYVRRMLSLAGVGPLKNSHDRHKIDDGDIEIRNYRSVMAPVKNGYSDLRSRLAGVSAVREIVRVMISFFVAYRVFFLLLLACLISLLIIVSYVQNVTKEGSDFEVTIDNPDISTTLNAEEIAYDALSGGTVPLQLSNSEDQTFTLNVINTSGKSGTAADSALVLTESGYSVTNLSADTTRTNKNTVIVFDSEIPDQALEISRKFGGALMSARTSSSTTKLPTITVFIGRDQIDD